MSGKGNRREDNQDTKWYVLEGTCTLLWDLPWQSLLAKSGKALPVVAAIKLSLEGKAVVR